MRIKILSHGLFMASSLFMGVFARTCRPQTASFSSSFSEITFSTATASAPASQSTFSTESMTILTSTSETFLPSTISPDTTVGTSTSVTTGTLDVVDTSSSNIVISTTTAEDTTAAATQTTSIDGLSTSSIDTTSTSSIEAIATTSSLQITSAVDSTAMSTTVAVPGPTSYLRSTSNNPSFNNLNMHASIADASSTDPSDSVVLIPSTGAQSRYSPAQVYLEEGTNRLMMDSYYFVAPQNARLLMLANSAVITADYLYITCAPFVRDQAVNCQLGSIDFEFMTVLGGGISLVDPGSYPQYSRLSFSTVFSS